MRLFSMLGLLMAGLSSTLFVATASAQGVAVPIVGSPAAEQKSGPQPTPSPAQLPSGRPPGPADVPVATQTPQVPTVPMYPAGRSMPVERKLELSINQGMVTLAAQNVTVREILAEWQRRTGCQFVNAERLPGGPVTIPLSFSAKPELEVIDSLLRGAAGYMVGPRSDSAQTGSMCGVVYILPTSVATSAPATYMPGASPMPLAAPLVQPGLIDDEVPPVAVSINPPRPVVQPSQPMQGQPGVQPGAPAQTPGQVAPAGFGPVPVMPTAPGGRGASPTGPTPPGGGRGGGGTDGR